MEGEEGPRQQTHWPFHFGAGVFGQFYGFLKRGCGYAGLDCGKPLHVEGMRQSRDEMMFKTLLR